MPGGLPKGFPGLVPSPRVRGNWWLSPRTGAVWSPGGPRAGRALGVRSRAGLADPPDSRSVVPRLDKLCLLLCDMKLHDAHHKVSSSRVLVWRLPSGTHRCPPGQPAGTAESRAGTTAPRPPLPTPHPSAPRWVSRSASGDSPPLATRLANYSKY